MKRIVFDIEGNGLLDVIDTIWCATTKDITTGEVKEFSDFMDDLPSTEEFLKEMDSADVIIGHNIIRYDLEVLRKVYGWVPKESTKLIDTLILSRLNDFTRPTTKGKHGLDPWGESVGVKKPEVAKDEWMTWDPKFIHRCTQDVEINHKVYEVVLKEAVDWKAKKPFYENAMRIEHKIAELSAQQIRDGWLFNFDECQNLITMIKAEMAEIEEAIEPHLVARTVMIDKEPNTPKYKKNGEYTAVSARTIGEYLGYHVDPCDALKASPPLEPGVEFQRSKLVPASLGNQDIVKDYLESIGWVPDEWNMKFQGVVNGRKLFEKTSPKFTSKSLLACGHEHAKMIDEYYTLRARRAVLEGWMEQAEGDGRLHGDVNDTGAATFRQTHKIIANLPGANAKYGKEVRSLFVCPPDKTIISADGASYQIRVLAHYLKDKDYIDTVLNGDPHQMNADIMGVPRSQAKGIFFAVLFGAGAGKVGNIMGKGMGEGKKARNAMINGIPNLRNLIERLEQFWQAQEYSTGRGWIPSIDGRKVYAESAFKTLNYLIQSTETCLMKATIAMIAEEFKKNNIENKQLLFYHDECSWEIDPKDADKANEIIGRCFRDAPKQYGVDIMDAGDIKTGDNYYEVH